MKKLIWALIISFVIFPLISFTEGMVDHSPILAVKDNASSLLQNMKKAAIFLTGNDAILTRLAEDLLSINMLNKGYDVVNRETLEKVIGEQIALKKKNGEDETINALNIGKLVDANSVITGTVILDYDEDGTFSSKLSSFQLISVDGVTLISAVYELPEGKLFSEISKGFAEIIMEKSK